MTGRSRTLCSVVLSVASLVACGGDGTGQETTQDTTQGIIGGSNAVQGAWPSMVFIKYQGNPWCGGTLIGSRWVLTARHCFENLPNGSPDLDPTHYEADVGIYDRTAPGYAVAVSDVVPYPIPSPTGLIGIGLLHLAQPSAFPPRRLMTPGRMSEVALYDDVTILGWGNTAPLCSPSNPDACTYPNILQAATVDFLGGETTCPSITNWPASDVVRKACIGLVAGGKADCFGDSGGPSLILRDNEWFLLGVIDLGPAGVCDQAGYPPLHALPSLALDWLQSVATDLPAQSWLPSAQIMAIL